MLTNDNSIVSIEAIYQYTIRDVKQYYFDVDDPEGTLQLAFEAIIRRNIQNRPLDDALLNKEEIERQVLPDFQALIDTYEMGVKINDVRIQNITVPADVSAAYEDVNNAKNEKTKRLDEAEKYANEVLPEARSRAYQTLQEAEAYKAETIAAAGERGGGVPGRVRKIQGRAGDHPHAPSDRNHGARVAEYRPRDRGRAGQRRFENPRP